MNESQLFQSVVFKQGGFFFFYKTCFVQDGRPASKQV